MREPLPDASVAIMPPIVARLAGERFGAKDRQLIRAGRKQAAGFSWRRAADGLTGLYHRAAEAR